MGLDITAHQNIRKLDCVFDAGGDPIDPKTQQLLEDDCFHVTPNPHYASRAEGVENGVYVSEKQHGFRAGSYSGYNNWRNQLAELAGYKPVEAERYGERSLRHDEGAWRAENGPFWELINFSDCEGIIGPITSAKLAKDFADFQTKADDFGDEYFRERYANWRTAFEMAAQNGCVDFH